MTPAQAGTHLSRERVKEAPVTDSAENQSLEDQLGAVRARAIERTPPERRAAIVQSFAELEQSHVPHVFDVGDVAPDFTLPVAQSAEVVTLSTQLKQGPVVLSFYRGHW